MTRRHHGPSLPVSSRFTQVVALSPPSIRSVRFRLPSITPGPMVHGRTRSRFSAPARSHGGGSLRRCSRSHTSRRALGTCTTTRKRFLSCSSSYLRIEEREFEAGGRNKGTSPTPLCDDARRMRDQFGGDVMRGRFTRRRNYCFSRTCPVSSSAANAASMSASIAFRPFSRSRGDNRLSIVLRS